MSYEQVPEDVRAFILRYINSIAQLEALLLLWRSPEKAWDVPALASRLYIGESETVEALAPLSNDGLLVADQNTYRFNRAADDLPEMVARLAAVYAKQLIPVTNIIHAKPRRIREFADAFKLKKDR
jgi:hypothetical protein